MPPATRTYGNDFDLGSSSYVRHSGLTNGGTGATTAAELAPTWRSTAAPTATSIEPIWPDQLRQPGRVVQGSMATAGQRAVINRQMAAVTRRANLTC